MESKLIILVVIAAVVRDSFAGVVGTPPPSVGLDDIPLVIQNSTFQSNLQECRDAFRTNVELVFDHIARLLPNSTYTPIRDPGLANAMRESILKGINAYSRELLSISPESAQDVSNSQSELTGLIDVWLSASDGGILYALDQNDPDFPAHIATMKAEMNDEVNKWFGRTDTLIATAARSRTGGLVISEIAGLQKNSILALGNTLSLNREIAAAMEILHDQASDTPVDQDKFYLDRYNAIKSKKETATTSYVTVATNLFDLLKVLNDIPRAPKL